MNLYGVEFEDDEVEIAMIDGNPEWVVSLKGARRLAENAPNRAVAEQFLAYLDRLPPEGAQA